MNPIAGLGLRARRGFGRIVPEPFVIAIVLTALVYASSVVSGRGALDALRDWSGGSGLWALLKFTMQMCTMLVLGSALAAAPAVRSAIERSVGAARSARGLVGLVAFASIALALVNWSLGIVGGALLARAGGEVARRRKWALHYPLLCAAGYAGLMAWHGGLSGSAPLKVTQAADVVEVLGPQLAAQVGTVPLSETIFSPLNLLVSGGLLVLGPLLFMALVPARDPDPMEPPPRTDAYSDEDAAAIDAEGEGAAAPGSAIERFERSPVHLWLLALPMSAAVGLATLAGGLSRLSFDTVNLALWTAALVLHGRLDRFVRACERGIVGCTAIVLQFPLYAGIMGMMAGAGLSEALSRLFVAAGSDALPLLAFASAGLVNLFVPSGGGQWAVQGPILVEGALGTGVPVGDVVLAMAYGDQWTNMLQPFWALPLLAITGVRARDIIGYTTLWMVVGGAWIACHLWLTV